MFNVVRDMFRPRAAETLAAQELELARRQLLEAQSAREYAEAMCTYHQARINRLRAVACPGSPSTKPYARPATPDQQPPDPTPRGRLDNLNLPSVGPHGY